MYVRLYFNIASVFNSVARKKKEKTLLLLVKNRETIETDAVLGCDLQKLRKFVQCEKCDVKSSKFLIVIPLFV